jgi:hypothetical protein
VINLGLKWIENKNDNLKSEGPVIKVVLEVPQGMAKELERMGRPLPPPYETDAILDTGSNATLISEEIVRKLGLEPVGQAKIKTTMGSHNSRGFQATTLKN